MRRKRLTILFAFLVLSLPILAVVNNRSLDQTLRDVKGELREDWLLRQQEQQRLQHDYEWQHQQMLDIIRDCNELSMTLYLQKKEFTFDLSYALQQVSRQYNEFSRSRTPYDVIVSNLDLEIDRYARFLEALRRLPPVLQELPDVIPDSLAYRNAPLDSLSGYGTSLEREVIALAAADSLGSPFVLSPAGQADRDSCLFYAGELLKIYAENKNTVMADSLHYQEAFLRLKESYDYALIRYNILKQEIFVQGQTPWWTILANFPHYWGLASASAHAQYSADSLEQTPDLITSLGKGMNTLLLIAASSLLFFLLISWLFCHGLFCLLCWLIKPLGRAVPREIRRYISLLLGVLLYSFLFSAADSSPQTDLAFRQISTFSWLLSAIVVALMVRLAPHQIRSAFRLYLPTVFMTLVVIVCRVSNVPNVLMNVLFPPALLLILLWQVISFIRRRYKVMRSDRIICLSSLAVTGIAAVLAICGYIFVSLMVLVWWYFQLAVIHTLTAIGHLLVRYRDTFMARRVNRMKDRINLIFGANRESMLFAATWFYDLVKGVVLPGLALLSIPFCIKYSLNVFEFNDLFQQIYYEPFIQVMGTNGGESFRISFQAIVLVAGLLFVFRYLNIALHAFWQQGRYVSIMKKTNRKTVRANEVNLSLGNSLISVGVWFLYFVVIFKLLRIPTGSLGLVAGGLSAGVGLAMKDIINNFIYGIQLMSGRLRVGDWIECDGIRGQVKDINYQSTQVETVNATTVSFLNATLFGKSFTNLTKGNSYEFMKILVGVPYGTDIEEVRGVLEKAMEVMKTKDEYGRDVVDPARGIYVRFSEFSESAVEIAVKQYVLAAKHIAYRDKAKEVIYNALNEAGITIPFPQRDIHIITSSHD